MIVRPSGFRGAAFTTARAGDMARGDRFTVSTQLGIKPEWATARQIHGAKLLEVKEPGRAGEGDALFTVSRALPLAVFTADCAAIVLESAGAVAVVHAGWRGAAAGVVSDAAGYLEERASRHEPVLRAAMGPLIGPCCFEVGDEVAAVFPGWESTTTWRTTSVDLGGAIRAQVPGAKWWSLDACTRCGDGWFSHRANATRFRQAAIGWIP
ncbi:MAG: polyphenol oxidase family protein [bacterium]|nr:polyphenol oxidase family protein [bacterium]